MPNDRLHPSTVLAERYEIQRLIGRGGMAEVYLARDRRHDRAVAVKVLHPDLTRELAPERFAREIAIAANLRHPHILPLYDSGESDGSLFYVMPYVAGESLRDRLEREKQLPLEEALRLTCQLAGALEYAHGHGVLHRDIKPENILLEDGEAVIADFGIACALAGTEADRLTATGHSLGTPSYMSPEQVTGQPTPDGRSDLYSLAAVLYEMLAGEPPFTGPTAQVVIAKRFAGPPPSVRVVRPAVPEGVDGALRTALQTTPADRFASTARFREALEVCARDDTRGAGIASGTRAPRRWRMAAALALAVASLSAVLLWSSSNRVASMVPTLAILPLRSLSADPAFSYMAEGFTGALIEELGRARTLRAIPMSSAIRFAAGGGGMEAAPAKTPGAGGMGMAGMDAAPATTPAAGGMAMPGMGGDMADARPPASYADIARQLGADLVMEGSFLNAGDTVRVTVTIIDPATQRAVWNETYVRPTPGIHRLQLEIAGAVLQAVTGAAPLEQGPQPTWDPAAHEAFLKAGYHQEHWQLTQAIEDFEEAVRIDPTHAPALAGLARAYYFRAFFGDIAPAIAFAAMRQAATAALQLDPSLPEAHAQMALVQMLQEWDWQAAEQSFRRALELAPNDAQIRHDYAHFLLGQGRHEESREASALALSLDPANPMLTSCLGWHSLFSRDHDRAILYATEANSMMPGDWANTVLGWARLGKGQADSALVALREASRLSDRPFTLAALAHGLAVTGHDAEAREVLGDLLRRTELEYVSAYDIATVYAGLGEADEVFRWLRRAAEERSTFIVHLGWDVRFEPLHGDPRYRALLEGEMRLRMPAPTTAAQAAA